MDSLLTNDNNEHFAVPDSLKHRLMRGFGWSSEFAGSALEGYRQFMKLKLQLEDWDATALSPSLVVDRVWHEHLLDNKHYNQACLDYAKTIIYHDPDGALNKHDHAERLKTTKVALKVLFGQGINTDVWNFPNDATDRTKFVVVDDRTKKRHRSDDTLTLEFQFCVHEQLRVYYLSAEKKEKFGVVFGRFAAIGLGSEGKLEHASHWRFLLDGERIEPTQIPDNFELSDVVVIDVLEEQTGC